MSVAPGLLVAGTSSDAGKSLLVTGLCRAYARRGLRVAPFKAQNMSNNSGVCPERSTGGWAEIGRAQFLQAQAARVEPSALHNPVLLKPGSDRTAHVIVRGRAHGVLHAGEYATGRGELAAAAFAAFAELAGQNDLVIAEGAGSPAEINLRAGDYVNLGLAERFDLPVVVVGDIDRGGILAALYGTWAILDERDRRRLRAFVINKFRGDPSVLQPGLDEIHRRTGVPFLGVVPWLEEVWLDSEDTLDHLRRGPTTDPVDDEPDRLRVAVVRFPRISNATDVDALAAEPGVDVRVTADPAVLLDADLAVLPGTRATVADLDWLERRGLAAAVRRRAALGRPVLGICGGYQMLARTIDDEVESGRGRGRGLGLLPVDVAFGADKVLGRPGGHWRGLPVQGYEIHHGRAAVGADAEPFLDGVRVDAVWGTMWHGTLESDEFRRTWLAEVASATGATWRPDPAAPAFGARREAMIERLADAVEEHVDLDALLDLR